MISFIPKVITHIDTVETRHPFFEPLVRTLSIGVMQELPAHAILHLRFSGVELHMHSIPHLFRYTPMLGEHNRTVQHDPTSIRPIAVVCSVLGPYLLLFHYYPIPVVSTQWHNARLSHYWESRSYSMYTVIKLETAMVSSGTEFHEHCSPKLNRFYPQSSNNLAQPKTFSRLALGSSG